MCDFNFGPKWYWDKTRPEAIQAYSQMAESHRVLQTYLLEQRAIHQDIKEDEMRRAARQDTNQPELVLALRRIGAKVYHIGKPLDLLVGYRGRNILMEIKREDRAGWDSEFTQEQKVFIETWPGEIAICHTIEEAINAVVNGSK